MRLDLPFGCLAATALSAWLPGQELPTYPRLDLMVPRGLTDVHYGRSVVADMSGHHLPDVVVLATGTDAQNQNVRTALFASAPALHSMAERLPGCEALAINDIAVLRRAGSVGSRDLLALVTDQGLFEWHFGGARTRLGGNLWDGAKKVRTGHTDTDGIEDVVGLVANGTNLRVHPRGGQNGWFVNTQGQVLDFELLDWCTNSGGSTDEIVYAHASKVGFVVDGQIDPARQIAIPDCESVQLLVLDTPSIRKRLVVLCTPADGPSSLVSLTADGPQATVRILPGKASSATVVDEPTGQEDGLVLRLRGTGDALHFRFVGGLAGFDEGSAVGPDFLDTTAAQLAHYLDLDGDGDRDVIGPADARGGLVMTQDATSGEIVGLDLPRIAPTWADAIEVVCFQVVRTTPNPEAPPVHLHLQPSALGSVTLAVQDALADPSLGNLQVGPIAMVSRFVRRVGGVVVQRGPVSVAYWSTPDDRLWLGNVRAVMDGTLTEAQLGMVAISGGVGTSGDTTPPRTPPPPPPGAPPDGGG